MTKIAAFGFILALISSACTWLMGSDRSQAVACYDGAGPRVLGRFSAKLGTPVNVNFLSGVISTIVFVAAAKIAGGSASATFDVMIGIVLTFTTISYIVIFPCLIKLRYSHPHVNRPYKVPGGIVGVWICGVVCTFWAAFASLVAIFPGFLDGQLLNNDGLARGCLALQVHGDRRRCDRDRDVGRHHLLLARQQHAGADGRRAARGKREHRLPRWLPSCPNRPESALSLSQVPRTVINVMSS